MATYFKYAEKEADSYINWAEIGKSMSDMLATENKIREDKKAAIDQASREFGEQLASAPQGEHKGMNQWALEYAADAQQARLMQDKLLKSGQLKLKDYVVMRQNINDGTNQAFDLMKEYQTEYTNKIERMKAEKSQDLEPWLMAEAEGFANFSNTKLYINPTDGTISVAKTKEGPDGVKTMSDNPNDFTTVNALRNRMKGHFDRFDVASNVGSYVQGLGEEINTLTNIKNKYQRGTITEILDITNRENLGKDEQGAVIKFEEAERKMLESMMANPYNTSSILTNGLNFDKESGKEYTFTWSEDEAKANSNLILLKNDPKSGNPMPQFSEAQKEAAFVYLRTQARLMYDKTEKTTVVGANEKPRPSDFEMRAARERQEREQLYQAWQDLYTGDNAKVQAATDAILGNPEMKAEGLIKISRGKYTDKDGTTKYGVTFEYADPNKNRSVPFTDANNQAKNPSDWFSSGTEVIGKPTVSEVKKYGVGTFSGTDITSSSERAYKAEAPADDSVFNKYVLKEGYIGEDSPENTVNHLRNKFSDFGFTFSGKSDYGSDYVTIIPANGEAKTFQIDDQSQLGEIQNFLMNNAINKNKLTAPAPAPGANSNVGSKYNEG